MLLRELKVRYETTREPNLNPQLRNPEDAARLLSKLLDQEAVEVLIALYLDAKHRVICWHEVSRGTVNQTAVHPRDVFKGAYLANASGIVLGHNHNSGDPTPSAEDVALTRRMKEIGQLLGMEVLDSIIVSPEGRYHSFKEHGGLS